ncbi:MAG: hypothetical protein ACJ79A_02185 [Gemmatimonadaceae bacterium]
MQPPQLDLQLAWAFRDFPVVWGRLASRGVELADVGRAWTRHLHMRNAGQTLLSLEEHAAFYGVEPRQERERDVVRLRWPLTLWPEYELAGFFAPDTGVVEEGLRFREPPLVGRASGPLTLDQATALLRLGEHTEVELSDVLGPGDPDYGNGWSPESYFYYDLADGRSLRCLTVHGLLVELVAIDARPARMIAREPAPVRRRRWWEFWKPAA